MSYSKSRVDDLTWCNDYATQLKRGEFSEVDMPAKIIVLTDGWCEYPSSAIVAPLYCGKDLALKKYRLETLDL